MERLFLINRHAICCEITTFHSSFEKEYTRHIYLRYFSTDSHDKSQNRIGTSTKVSNLDWLAKESPSKDS